MTQVSSLVAYQRCCDRLKEAWPRFLAKREDRLAQERRFGAASEKVAENILEDLFTVVLDWGVDCFNNQVDYADIVLTRLGIKHLLVEVKRPGALAWNQASVSKALDQARGYAEKQKIKTIAVSDGLMLYARDQVPGGSRDRLFVRLDQPEAPEELWWLSVDGIYRARDAGNADSLRLLPEVEPSSDPEIGAQQTGVVHPKYQLPCSCFAYVGTVSDPHTWHLPYRRADGGIDRARLPKAIQSILSNYRGAHVTGIPEPAIPEVLVALGRAAHSVGKLPVTGPRAPRVYVQLQQALNQLGRVAEVING